MYKRQELQDRKKQLNDEAWKLLRQGKDEKTTEAQYEEKMCIRDRIGGGTLQGLSRLLLKTHDIHQVSELAEKGDVTRVNLQIGDICNTGAVG